VIHGGHRALGHGASRGKIYYAHPELFKVMWFHFSDHCSHPIHSILQMVMTRLGCTTTSIFLYMVERSFEYLFDCDLVYEQHILTGIFDVS